MDVLRQTPCQPESQRSAGRRFGPDPGACASKLTAETWYYDVLWTFLGEDQTDISGYQTCLFKVLHCHQAFLIVSG